MHAIVRMLYTHMVYWISSWCTPHGKHHRKAPRKRLDSISRSGRHLSRWQAPHLHPDFRSRASGEAVDREEGKRALRTRRPRARDHTHSDAWRCYRPIPQRKPNCSRKDQGAGLEKIKGFDLASRPCAEITSDTLVQFTHEISEGRKPQTVGNYLSHLSAIFAIARPAWG